jgi:flagellar basal-body rod protein FlgC
MSVTDYFDSIAISATGLSAERIRMNTIANNIANMHTTRTEDGGPYRRQYVIFEEVLNRSRKMESGLADGMGGVSVAEIGKSDDLPRMVYEPGHPDAIEEGPNEGMVAMPNIDPVSEMVDMISAQRAYEANVQAIAAARSIILRSLDICK